MVSSTNKTDHYDIAEILLKVALNTKKLTLAVIDAVKFNGRLYTNIELPSLSSYSYTILLISSGSTKKNGNRTGSRNSQPVIKIS